MKWSDVGKKYKRKEINSKFSTKPVPPEFAKLHLSSIVKQKSNPSWSLLCPFHADKKSPSCHVIVEPGTPMKVGFFNCFGCGHHGFWEELASKLHLPLYDEFKDVKGTRFSPLRVNKQEEDEFDLKVDISILERWPVKRFWRTFSGGIIRRHGGYLNPASTTYPLVWVCRQKPKSKIIGTIRSRIKPDATEEWPSYLYSSGAWIAKYLWPQHKLSNIDKVVFVEGKRDALALLKYDIPTLAILGTQTGAGPTRINTLHRLGVEKVLTFTDNDLPGKQAVLGLKSDGVVKKKGLKKLLSKEFDVTVYRTWKRYPKKKYGKLDPHKLFKKKAFRKKFIKLFEEL